MKAAGLGDTLAVLFDKLAACRACTVAEARLGRSHVLVVAPGQVLRAGRRRCTGECQSCAVSQEVCAAA